MNDKSRRKPPALPNVLETTFSLVTTVSRSFSTDQGIWKLFLIAVLAVVGEVLPYHVLLVSVAAAATLTGLLTFVLPIALQVGLFAGLSLLGIASVPPVISRALGGWTSARDPICACRFARCGVVRKHLPGRIGGGGA